MRLAAHSWLASAMVMCWGTVRAGPGRRAATVPGSARVGGGFLDDGEGGAGREPPLRRSSASTFLRIAWTEGVTCRASRTGGSIERHATTHRGQSSRAGGWWQVGGGRGGQGAG